LVTFPDEPTAAATVKRSPIAGVHAEPAVSSAVAEVVAKPINLLIDATFFRREYGFLVFHDCQKVIYFKEIKTESVKDFK
jgi:hypothetical protein